MIQEEYRMKKLLILLCALALTGCGGGGGKNSASSSDLIEYPEEMVVTERTSPADLVVYDHDDWGVTLTAEDVTAGGCTIVCAQSGGKNVAELMSGAAFVLEVKDGAGWATYPNLFEEGRVTWTQEGWIIPLGDSVKWQTDWSWLYGELPAGEYRIGKEVMNFRGTGDFDEMPYYAEFVVK